MCRRHQPLPDGRAHHVLHIGSAVFVMAQFALFSLVGTLLWIKFGGRTPAQLGLSGPDDLFPEFIIRGLPPGISGLMVAGILGATMGSLSSAMNSMSNSTLTDLIRLFGRRDYGDRTMLRISRISTLFWAGALVGFASMCPAPSARGSNPGRRAGRRGAGRRRGRGRR